MPIVKFPTVTGAKLAAHRERSPVPLSGVRDRGPGRRHGNFIEKMYDRSQEVL